MVKLPFSPESLNGFVKSRAADFGLAGFDSKREEEQSSVDESLFLSTLSDHEATVKYLSSDYDVYGDCTTIDWIREYAKERLRLLRLRRLRGLEGVGIKLWNTAAPWIVITITGVLTGLLAAFLAIVTVWLSDLRQGVCPSEFYLNQDACCAGLEPGEICYSWMTWADLFKLKAHAARAVIPYFVYLFTGVGFATCSAVLVQCYAPQAFHTGIPEIKTILNGYILQGFLSSWTLVIKSLGLTLAVASGLSLGNEGPLVHIACSIGSIVANRFAVFRENQARKREILSAAAAAGISVAFGAPLGGVLFSLEELSSFFPDTVLWQSFVCAIVAAVTLQYVDPYGTGRLVLFQVTASQVYRGFELIPFVFLGIVGGVFGHYFIRLNIAYAKFRASELSRTPILEVSVVALLTALVSYLIVYARIPTAELVETLFSDCSSDPYGLCDRDHQTFTIFLLLVTALAKTAMTAATFGMRVPAGIFLPSIAIGSCIGRAVGMLVSSFQQAYPLFFLFSGCPADGPCVSPTIYAVIGAAAVLAGTTRMTISLTVVFFELTGAVTSVLSIMIAIMVSKFTGDFLAKDGIYESWIKLRSYPFLDPKIEYRRDDTFVKDLMTPAEDIISLKQTDWTVTELEEFIKDHPYRGYPIVKSHDNDILCGYILRNDLLAALSQARLSRSTFGTTRCTFAVQSNPGSRDDGNTEQAGVLNLAPWANQTPMTLSVKSPAEIAVHLFQRMGLRYLLLTRRGRLEGILTKTDIHDHLCSKSGSVQRPDFQRRRQGRVNASSVDYEDDRASRQTM